MKNIEGCTPHQRPSYIADDHSLSIMFLPCGVLSFDRREVIERYCPRCNRVITKTFEIEE